MKHRTATLLLAFLIALFTAADFYYLVNYNLPSFLFIPALFVKVFSILILLLACGSSIQRLLGLEGEYGLMLIRTKKGLDILDELARANPQLWRTFADFGTVLGFGLCSIFIFKQLPKKTFIFSMVGLLIFSQLILPAAAPLILELISLPASSQGIGLSTAAASGASDSTLALLSAALFYMVFLSMLVGGLALAGIAGLALKTFTILFAVTAFLSALVGGVHNTGILATEGPGAAPVLPGINLPFFEGILALAVLLVVHESAHGILARVEKIPLKSAGIVLFGIIPIGAFIDPDEKKLQKAEQEKQNRVLVAGSTANLVTAVIFLVFLLFFQSLMLAAYPTDKMGTTYVEVVGTLNGSSAQGFITPGMKILAWRGSRVSKVSDFVSAANGTKACDLVQVVTDSGTFMLRAGTDGKVGVSVLEHTYGFSDYVGELSARGKHWPGFVFNFLALAFILNILVGIVNLLPIPAFDGNRIVSGMVGEKKIFGAKAMDLIAAFIVLAFLANLLPWLWT